MTNTNSITIAIDCLGGDNYPDAQVEGVAIFLRKYGTKNLRFLLFGSGDELKKKLKSKGVSERSYSIVNTDKKISSEEKPSVALRKGKDSSMWMALEAVRQGEANACVSAGNTGALMAMSKLILRPLEGVDRPALVQMMPAKNGGAVALLDMGANIDCSSTNLYQFALMGSIFYSAIANKKEPTIGLLNIGSEDIKGNDVVKHTAVMLRESILSDNFYGFVEGNDIFRGIVDVVVADGFTGNVALKTIEGTAKFILGSLKGVLNKSPFVRLFMVLLPLLFITLTFWMAPLFLKILLALQLLLLASIFLSLEKLKNKFSPESYNGALFIGLNGISVKSHGNANGLAFYRAIENTVKLVEGDINNRILNLLSKTEIGEMEGVDIDAKF